MKIIHSQSRCIWRPANQAALRVHGEDHVDDAPETMVDEVVAPIDMAPVTLARIER
jgi:hypothetical protein